MRSRERQGFAARGVVLYFPDAHGWHGAHGCCLRPNRGLHIPPMYGPHGAKNDRVEPNAKAWSEYTDPAALFVYASPYAAFVVKYPPAAVCLSMFCIRNAPGPVGVPAIAAGDGYWAAADPANTNAPTAARSCRISFPSESGSRRILRGLISNRRELRGAIG